MSVHSESDPSANISFSDPALISEETSRFRLVRVEDRSRSSLDCMMCGWVSVLEGSVNGRRQLEREVICGKRRVCVYMWKPLIPTIFVNSAQQLTSGLGFPVSWRGSNRLSPAYCTRDSFTTHFFTPVRIARQHERPVGRMSRRSNWLSYVPVLVTVNYAIAESANREKTAVTTSYTAQKNAFLIMRPITLFLKR